MWQFSDHKNFCICVDIRDHIQTSLLILSDLSEINSISAGIIRKSKNQKFSVDFRVIKFEDHPFLKHIFLKILLALPETFS